MFYTVGEMAKKLHMAPSTLRYYDKEGLLLWSVQKAGTGCLRIRTWNGWR